MRRSGARILTTHVGRLERPDTLTAAMQKTPNKRPTDPSFASELESTVRGVVRQQVEAGVDVVCDGEFGKLSWLAYLNARLGGYSLVAVKPGETAGPISRDRVEFKEFYDDLQRSGTYYYRSPGRDAPPGMRWACTGPVSYVGQSELKQDLANLRAAVDAAGAAEAFVSATTPVRPRTNLHYPNEDDYYAAVGEAMRTEYTAIVEAGFILQIDDPLLPGLWSSHIPALSVEDYRKLASKHVEIVNHALRGIPQDKVRYHICWGSWHGPHVDDLPLRDVVDILLRVNAGAYCFEAANVRHEHEWQVWEGVKLPAGKILIPGVVAHATNIVEHPELVAWRLGNFARLVGKENVMAGTDCGMGYRVHPQVGWAKLKAMAEGARLASNKL